MKTGQILFAATAGALALGGCVPKPKTGYSRPVGFVRVEAGPCFGVCPSYTVTARSDGSGRFVGGRFAAAQGEREIRLKADGYARLTASLAPYKPAAGMLRRIVPGEKDCVREATDMPGYELDWSDGAKLSYYAGCMDDRNEALRAAIGAMPEVLGIERLLRK